MDSKWTEKEIFQALQGHWQGGEPAVSFEIAGHKVLLSGGNAGLGIPGFDNTGGDPLVVKWHEDLGRWQVFSDALGWLLAFIESVQPDQIVIAGYNVDKAEFEQPVVYTRNDRPAN